MDARLVLRVCWVVIALVMTGYAGWVWLRIRRLERTQAARGAGRLTRRWLGVHARIAGGLSAVGALNLAVGLLSLSTPVRPDAAWPPRHAVDWVVVAAPLLLIASALVKAWIAYSLAAAYRAITRARP